MPELTADLRERRSRGRARRSTVPRRALGEWVAVERDPVDILSAQNEPRLPELVPIRMGRMLRSPFTFYRGSAALMAGDLAHQPTTGIRVVACGDAHISNFGFYASPERRLLFDLNDFDEGGLAPWEWDLRRLTASAYIGGRERGLAEDACRDVARGAAHDYRVRLRHYCSLSVLERYYANIDAEAVEAILHPSSHERYQRLVRRARRRDSERVFRRITGEDAEGAPRIVEDPPVLAHVEGLDVEAVTPLWDQYRSTLREDVAVLLSHYRLVDVARRVVGVGSVGTRCFIVLLIDPGGSPLFLQVKEANETVLSSHGGMPAILGLVNERDLDASPGHRVVAAQRILQAHSDPFLGWISADGRHFYWRQFRDMKGAVEIERLTAGEYAIYCQICAALLARAHSQSPSAQEAAAYLGKSEACDEAMAQWARQYADQCERDYAALEDAVRDGRVAAERGV